MTHSLTYARLRAMLVRFGPKVGDVFGGARCRPLCPFVALREEACPLVAVLVAWGEEVSGPARRCLVPLVVVALCRRVLLLSMSTASLSDAASPEWHFRRIISDARTAAARRDRRRAVGELAMPASWCVLVQSRSNPADCPHLQQVTGTRLFSRGVAWREEACPLVAVLVLASGEGRRGLVPLVAGLVALLAVVAPPFVRKCL